MSQVMAKQKQKLPPLREYIYPPDIIKKAVDDLSLYYQLNHQNYVELYQKWKNKTTFSGDFGEKIALDEIRELIDKGHGKNWQVLLKAIFLIDRFTTEIDMHNFYKLSRKEQIDVAEVIANGQKASIIIEKWLKPLNQENVFEAINKASSVTIGNKKYDKLQILRYSKINSLPNEENSVKIYPHILEIDDPSALVEYFKNLKEPIYDSLIITFMRHKKYDFKTSVYLFFIWKGVFYIIDLSERRLNIDNPAGERRPDQYLDRMFGDVFLPVDLFLSKEKPKTTDLVVRDKKIFKRETIENVFNKSPAIQAWVNLFLYRIVDYVENNQNKIPLGVSTLDVTKALEDKSNKKIEKRVKIDNYHSSFESSGDASSYLLEKYSKDITSVVVSEKALPMIIGTRKYLESVIEYKKRDQVAKDLQELIIKDYNKNHKRVYNWFRKFIKKQDKTKLVTKALEDKKYSFKFYSGASLTDENKAYVQGTLVEIDKSKKLQKMSILYIYDDKEDHLPYEDEDDLLRMSLTKTGHLWLKYRVRHNCCMCNKFKWSIVAELSFIDYRQICEFFDISQLDLPKEYVEHFHYQNEAPVGNSRLDDTDPVDEVHDLWFRENSPYRSGVTVNDYSSEHPHFDVRIPLCRRCFKKYGGVYK